MYHSVMEQTPKLSERRVALTMPADELNALDAYCAEGRRRTGEPFSRAEVIRLAIAKLVTAAPEKPDAT